MEGKKARQEYTVAAWHFHHDKVACAILHVFSLKICKYFCPFLILYETKLYYISYINVYVQMTQTSRANNNLQLAFPVFSLYFLLIAGNDS